MLVFCFGVFFLFLFLFFFCDLVLLKPKHDKRSIGGQASTFFDLPEVDTGVPRDCLLTAIEPWGVD